MRKSLLAVVLCAATVSITGCGSEASGSKSAGVPLSMNNPESKPDVSQLDDKTTQTLIAQARKLAVTGRPSKAIEMLSQAIGIAPDSATVYRVRADVYSASGEFANALADYSTAVRIEPGNASLYNLRGFFLMSRGESKRAEADFTKAIELKKDFAEAWNNRGLIYLAKNETAKAIKEFGQATKVKNDYVDAYNNRGFAYYKSKKFKQAEQDFTRALKINPEYVNSYNNRGLVHLQTKSFAKAVNDFTQAIKRNRFEQQYYVSRRLALLKLDERPAARADADRINWLSGLSTMNTRVAVESSNAGVYIDRGKYFEKAGEQEAAILDYTRALQLNPASVEALAARAAACNLLGKYDQAIADCNTALKLGENPDVHSVRGDAWLAKGDGAQAVADFEAAQRFDSQMAQAYLLRADRFEKSGDATSAQKDRQLAKRLDASIRVQ